MVCCLIVVVRRRCRSIGIAPRGSSSSPLLLCFHKVGGGAHDTVFARIMRRCGTRLLGQVCIHSIGLAADRGPKLVDKTAKVRRHRTHGTCTAHHLVKMEQIREVCLVVVVVVKEVVYRHNTSIRKGRTVKLVHRENYSTS